jgi:hypothetical protein
MAEWVTCVVNRAGPASDGTETPTPVIYINLTDQAGSFANQWFYTAPNARNEMLAVALSAISLGKTVTTALDPPSAGGSPYTQVYRLYIVA